MQSADIDRQIGWARARSGVRPTTPHSSALSRGSRAAALGAIIAGLIALYFWLSIELNPFAALGMIERTARFGADPARICLHVEAAQLASRPQLVLAQPAALIGLSSAASTAERSQARRTR
jgi:hypothetical protein